LEVLSHEPGPWSCFFFLFFLLEREEEKKETRNKTREHNSTIQPSSCPTSVSSIVSVGHEGWISGCVLSFFPYFSFYYACALMKEKGKKDKETTSSPSGHRRKNSPLRWTLLFWAWRSCFLLSPSLSSTANKRLRVLLREEKREREEGDNKTLSTLRWLSGLISFFLLSSLSSFFF